MGEQPIDRVLSAFSYFLTPDGYEEIFNAFIGLEALYSTDGSISVLEQIKRKSELLFGKIDGLNKKISKMYNVRSRLMHGTLPFPSKYYIKDATENFEKFLFNDYFETTKIANNFIISYYSKIYY